MRRRSRFADYLVYLIVRALVCVIQTLSPEDAARLARVLARIIHRVDKRHRLVAIENLRHAFGDSLTQQQREQMALGVYEHFCQMLMEIIHIPRKLTRGTWRDYLEIRGHEPLIEHLLEGGPVILLTGHFGNWEMAGYLLGAFGFAPSAVARELDNPYLERFLRKFREHTGQALIPKKGGYDQMLEVLRGGRVLGMLADQDAGANGVFVEFFGRPASTHKAIALLALEHNAVVAVGTAERVGPGFRYLATVETLLDPRDPQWAGNVRGLTQEYTRLLEGAVRRAPEQYLWLHRRWKHQPKPRGKAAKAAATSATPAPAPHFTDVAAPAPE